MEIKVILIDEDVFTLDCLVEKLHQLCSVEVIGVDTDPLIGKEVVKTTDVDLVFLAMDMSKLDGVELAEQIKQVHPNLPIVLLADNSEHAVKAFEMNVFDYIVKPVDRERLQLTIKRMNQSESIKLTSKQTMYLQLNLFGELSFIKYGENKNETIRLNWRTKKAEQLFVFLLHLRDRLVEKEEIIETLWQDVERKRAYEQMYVAVSHIRKALNPLKEHMTIKSRSDYYVLALENIRIDMDQFDELFSSNLSLSAESIAQYEAALLSNEGLLLKDYDYIWLEGVRQKYEFKWLQIAGCVMEYYEAHAKPYKGINLATLVCERFPFEEIGYLYLMKYNASIGRNVMVEKLYEELRSMVWEELQTYPSHQVIDWYRNWKICQCEPTRKIETKKVSG